MTRATMLVATPNTKHAQQLAFVIRFQNRPKRYGARNAPASAPQLTPIICAMNERPNVSYTMAITALITIKTATNRRIKNICPLGERSFFTPSRIRSSVSVELELMTREDSVLMDAETTRTSTNAIKIAGRLSESIAGMIPS